MPAAAVQPAAAIQPTPQPSVACATTTSTTDLGRLARLGPGSGVWVGMNLDWGAESVADVTSRLGSPPAAVVSFVSFPLTADDITNLQKAANQARDAGAVLVVTLQPWGGLSSVTDQTTADVARRLAAFGAEGVATIVRFAHEMNGTWYPWSQDPGAYVAAFRHVADAVHATAPTAAMLWAPNQGEGYPFTGGQYGAKPGGTGARALDTNGNGRLDPATTRTRRTGPAQPTWTGSA